MITNESWYYIFWYSRWLVIRYAHGWYGNKWHLQHVFILQSMSTSKQANEQTNKTQGNKTQQHKTTPNRHNNTRQHPTNTTTQDNTQQTQQRQKTTTITAITLQETNISPKNGILKMIFLFPRWDMLVSLEGRYPVAFTASSLGIFCWGERFSDFRTSFQAVEQRSRLHPGTGCYPTMPTL